MPPEEQANMPAEFGAGYGAGLELKDIYDTFLALSADLEVCTDNILLLIRTTTLLNKKTFIVLTKEQDEDLFKELAHVNKLLGKARSMLNAYITINDSIPDFPVFFNKLDEIEGLLDEQKDRIGFQVHVRDDGKYLYPTQIEKKVLMFKTMVGGICGTLQGVANFILHSPLLGGAGGGNSGGGGNTTGYSQPNRNWRNGIAPETAEETPEQSLGM